jgi:hypothetical protein
MVGRNRGYIIIVCLFIIFILFGLCTSLMVSNRQSLFLGLVASNKTKAFYLARGAANYALFMMRRDDRWRSKIYRRELRHTEGDNGSWTVTVEDKTPRIKIIRTKGEFSGVEDHYTMLVEEVSLQGSSTRIQDIDFEGIFAYGADGALYRSIDALNWAVVVDSPFEPGSLLTGNEGPIYGFSAALAPPPQEASTWVWNGLQNGDASKKSLTFDASSQPAGFGIEGAIEIPPIGTTINKHSNGKLIDGTEEGQKKYTTFTDDFGTSITVMVSTLIGDGADVYTVNRNAIASHKEKLYVMATHRHVEPSTFHNNWHWEDVVVGKDKEGHDIVKKRFVLDNPTYIPASQMEEWSVLEYTPDGGWRIVFDGIKSPAGSSGPPTKTGGPLPDGNSLAATSSQLYAYEKGTSNTRVISIPIEGEPQDKEWASAGAADGTSAALINIDENIYVHAGGAGGKVILRSLTGGPDIEIPEDFVMVMEPYKLNINNAWTMEVTPGTKCTYDLAAGKDNVTNTIMLSEGKFEYKFIFQIDKNRFAPPYIQRIIDYINDFYRRNPLGFTGKVMLLRKSDGSWYAVPGQIRPVRSYRELQEYTGDTVNILNKFGSAVKLNPTRLAYSKYTKSYPLPGGVPKVVSRFYPVGSY